MQLLKKFVSLILVVAMVSSFALVASAEETPNALLDVYDSNGELLPAGSQIQEGDTIKVQLRTTNTVIISQFAFDIAYDSTVLQYNESGSSLVDSVKTKFTMYDLNGFTQDVDEPGLAVGETAVRALWSAPLNNPEFEPDTVWAEMSFTALSTAESTEIRLIARQAYRLHDTDMDFDDVLSEFITQGATLSVAAAPVSVESVTVSPASITLNPNGIQQLTVEVTPSNATESAVWHSENEDVATVSDAGLVTAVGVGDTTITATAGGKSGSCAVKVEAADVITSFEANGPTEFYVGVGTNATPKVKYVTSDYSVPDIEWSSDPKDILTIVKLSSKNRNCKIAGAKVGTGYLYARAGNHEVKFTINVLKAIPTSVKIGSCIDSSLTYPVGRNIELTAEILPVEDWNLTWTSSDSDIAKVDGNVLTTVGAGTATITVSIYGQTATKTITVVDDSTLGESSYSANMAETGMKVVQDQVVTIPITIDSSETDAKFNDIHVLLSYDPEKLEFQDGVTGISDCQVSAKNGTVEITRYGTELPIPSILNVSFKVLMTEGSTNVVLKRAQVDLSDHALTANAPVASTTSAVTTLEIAVKHNVTLPDTMESTQGTTVADGGNYTFSIKDGVKDDYHDYTVSAKMDGEDTTVTENEDGSYTVKNVTGDLVISLDAAPKSYNVTLSGQDVTGESSATYGKDYTFTITEEEGYTYDVDVTVGGNAYAVTGEGGNYTIPGKDVTGDIVIKVTKKDSTGTVVYAVKVTGTGKDNITASATAKSGEAFSFKLTPVDGYMYTVDVIISGSTKKTTITENEDGTMTYTIAAADVTGNIFIEVAKEEAYKVTFDIADTKNISVKNAAALVKKGGTYEFSVDGFFMVYTLNYEITEGGNAKTATETVSGNDGTRRDHKFTITNVQGNLNIKLSWVANTDYVEVAVQPYVEMDNQTVYLVAACAKEGSGTQLRLDTYDGFTMYETQLYKDKAFNNPSSAASAFLWLTIVPKGESFGVEDALKHLTYVGAYYSGSTKPEALKNNKDVNQSGLIDINDAQLVFDIYNGRYETFYRTNAGAQKDPNYGIGASMNKFLEADVNRDMKVDVTDAAMVVNYIK